jgi:hypothetical protein
VSEQELERQANLKQCWSPGDRTLNPRIKSLLPRKPVTCAFASTSPLSSPFHSWSFLIVFGPLVGFCGVNRCPQFCERRRRPSE